VISPHQPDRAALQQLLGAVDPGLQLVRARPMAGGVSAAVTAIDARLPGGKMMKLVLRQYGQADVRAKPSVASDEYRLLAALQAAGLPVPRPYLADESCAVLPGPLLLIEFIDGVPGTGPRATADLTGRLAAVLAQLHKAVLGPADTAYLPDIRVISADLLGTRPPTLDAALSEAAIRAALAGSWPPAQSNREAVLHGDFWPGNTLWRHGRLVAVIDWEDAATGDPLADLGNARLELAMTAGAGAMHEFTRQYRALMPDLDVAALPGWDLYAALRPAGKIASWCLPAAKLAAMRAAHRQFVAGALARLHVG